MGNMDRCAARMRALSASFPYRLQALQQPRNHLLRYHIGTSAAQWLSTTSAASSPPPPRPPSPQADETPFYGLPRPETENRSKQNRISVALHSATTAFMDPARADAVAALGEITGSISLRRLHQTMMNDPTGRLILQDRPVVSKATIPYEKLMAESPDAMEDIDQASGVTFGQAYGAFLKGHGFDPDERDAVKHIDDEELAYVMLRYRQCHDFWHVLTGLPPTVVGELGIKWLELFQTGLPIAALSSTVGALRLDSEERTLLFETYLPWAIRTSQNATSCLMNVYYEKEFDTPLKDLRDRLQVEPAPKKQH